MNCVRVLTRILPFLYEADHLEDWEDKFFWASRRKRRRETAQAESDVLFDESKDDHDPDPTTPTGEFEEVKPLAEELIDTLTDLLFFSNFTLPRPAVGSNRVRYVIWQSGVGCNTAVVSSKEFESNRCEVLRLLLTMTSKSMYLSASQYLCLVALRQY